MMEILSILVICLIFCLVFLYSKIRFSLLSPIYLFINFNIISLTLALIYFFAIDKKINLFNFESGVTNLQVWELSSKYLASIICFILGIIAAFLFSRKSTKYLMQVKTRIKLNNSANHYSTFPRGVEFFSIISFVLFVVFLLSIYGAELFVRAEYLPNTNKTIQIGLALFSLLTVVSLGILYSSRPYTANFLFMVFLFLSMATASRRIAIYYLIYVALIFPFLTKSFIGKLKLLAAAIFFVFFSIYLIQLRGLNSHGLIPYLSFIGDAFSGIGYQLYFFVYYTFIYGFYVTLQSTLSGVPNWETSIISLNPLPGTIAGWYSISDTMRLNIYAPFSLYGEVFSMGWLFSMMFFFTIGWIFFLFEKAVKKNILTGRVIVAYIVLMMAGLFIIYAQQYNLRSASRLLYYTIIFNYAIIFFIYLINSGFFRLRKN